MLTQVINCIAIYHFQQLRMLWSKNRIFLSHSVYWWLIPLGHRQPGSLHCRCYQQYSALWMAPEPNSVSTRAHHNYTCSHAFNDWRPLLSYGYSCKASSVRPG